MLLALGRGRNFMSRKLLHLTRRSSAEPPQKISVNPTHIGAIFEYPTGCAFRVNGESVWVKEPYDVVLRMWVDALQGD